MTLPCNLFESRAVFYPSFGEELVVKPDWKKKALKAAQLTLNSITKIHVGGTIEIESNIPISLGLGSSTADVVASVRAVCDAMCYTLDEEDIAHITVRAETACDSLMFNDTAVLFAHRQGCVIETLGMPLPPLHVVGFNNDPDGTGVDTLAFPPADYSWQEVEMFRPIVGLLRRSIKLKNSLLLGQAATASSRLNQRFLPKPQFERILRIANDVKAIGLQVAHSGTVMGLLFDPAQPHLNNSLEQTYAELDKIGISQTWAFSVSSNL